MMIQDLTPGNLLVDDGPNGIRVLLADPAMAQPIELLRDRSRWVQVRCWVPACLPCCRACMLRQPGRCDMLLSPSLPLHFPQKCPAGMLHCAARGSMAACWCAIAGLTPPPTCSDCPSVLQK